MMIRFKSIDAILKANRKKGKIYNKKPQLKTVIKTPLDVEKENNEASEIKKFDKKTYTNKLF